MLRSHQRLPKGGAQCVEIRDGGSCTGSGTPGEAAGRPGKAAELGPEVARAAPPEGVRAGRAARSARTSCAAPEARVGH